MTGTVEASSRPGPRGAAPKRKLSDVQIVGDGTRADWDAEPVSCLRPTVKPDVGRRNPGPTPEGTPAYPSHPEIRIVVPEPPEFAGREGRNRSCGSFVTNPVRAYPQIDVSGRVPKKSRSQKG